MLTTAQDRPEEPNGPHYRILAFATQGAGGDDEARLRALLSKTRGVEWFNFDRSAKGRSFRALVRKLWSDGPDLVVMEGTGIGGGLALLAGRLRGVRYVVSSGDAVGPFVASIRPLLGLPFGLYERLLYCFAAGFIGWSPYLVGRALTFGTRRCMTAPGWAPSPLPIAMRPSTRRRIREELGIPENATVLGIVGSLAWSRRAGYCYGYELLRALEHVQRNDLWVLIVGDGSGRERLEAMARSAKLDRCRFTGRVPREQVPEYLAAIDVASLPQSLDRLGSFRYTTKISEYLAAGLPIVTGQLPLAYDLDGGWLWRLEGDAPWGQPYLDAMSRFMESLGPEELQRKTQAVPETFEEFDCDRQVVRVTRFLEDLLSAIPSH